MDSSPDGLLSEHQPDQSVITKNRNYIRMNMLKGNLILKKLERERGISVGMSLESIKVLGEASKHKTKYQSIRLEFQSTINFPSISNSTFQKPN